MESSSVLIHCQRAELTTKGNVATLNNAVEEYLELDHAEPVPVIEVDKPYDMPYYLPLH